MWAVLGRRVGAPCFQQHSRHFCVPSQSLASLQRRAERLSGLLRRVQHPQPTEFAVEGRIFPLPLSSISAPAGQLKQEDLDYLAGFFDGDGCVSMNRSTGRIQLSVNQAIDQASVLLHFRDALGGGICRHQDGAGARRATLRWHSSGDSAILAARLLGSVPSMKQAQLQIAVEGTAAPADRNSLADKLKMLKHLAYQPGCLPCSWHYLAGFFDAEGCIRVDARHATASLSISQLNPYVLTCIRRFLQQQSLHSWGLYSHTRQTELACWKGRECKETLKELLANGLLVKRGQAKLVLGLSSATHQLVRESIGNLKGNQGRYIRLDESAAAVAKAITSAQQKLRRKQITPEQALALQEELRLLKEDLETRKLTLKCNTLRADVRRLLREGGQVLSIA
ncbi:unnamed protein product [Effrenium voratum]|nr:unnamed protein product [Effrenium voratum]